MNGLNGIYRKLEENFITQNTETCGMGKHTIPAGTATWKESGGGLPDHYACAECLEERQAQLA